MNTLRAVLEATGAPWIILAVGILYSLQAGNMWMHGKHGLSVAFLGYAFANIGLYWAAVAA